MSHLSGWNAGHLMENNRTKILMLSAGAISGSFQIMMDILNRIDTDKFLVYAAYKPEFAEWGNDEIDAILNAKAKLVALRGKRLFGITGFIDLWKTLQREKIEILHSWDVLGVPGRIIAKLSGVKIVEALLNPPPVVPYDISWKHYMISKWTSILVHGFVACSNGVLQQYRKQQPLFLRGKKLSVVYPCVDTPNKQLSQAETSHLRELYALRQNDTVLTNIGYFNIQKAQSDLLNAFKSVTSKAPHTKLFLVGWGKLENHLRTLTKELGLLDKVIFTGKLRRSQVFDILSITDLFVLSSHWEGFGIVLTEAMALEKPVISTETDGSREIVEHGKTGILVPTGSPEILAEAILNLISKPALMKKMGRHGLKRVKETFDCKRFAMAYESFYLAVLQDN